jgi:hypothetical protein
MKNFIFASLLFISFEFNHVLAQSFKVVFLIDQVYEKTKLNALLESMNALSLIGEDYVQIKMISNSENQIKLSHDNQKEGKELKKCEVFGMSGVRCNPCLRLEQERKTSSVVYAATRDNDFGTCSMDLDDYKALSPSEDLSVLLKEERKIAKKSGKDEYKVIIWIPSNETVSINLVTDLSARKVDFGTLVNFTAKTNSKDYIPVIMRVNDVLVDECKDNGITRINKAEPLVKQIEITERTKVSLEGKGCGEPIDIIVELNEDCNEVEQVTHDLFYTSRTEGPLGKKIAAQNTEDGVACTEIKLVQNKLYILVINKQCGVREFKAELVDVQTKEKFVLTLRKSVEQGLLHLNVADQKSYMVYTLNHDELKAKGVFDLRKGADGEPSEPKFEMRIIPTEAVKDDLDIQGKQSRLQVVKFQKC